MFGVLGWLIFGGMAYFGGHLVSRTGSLLFIGGGIYTVVRVLQGVEFAASLYGLDAIEAVGPVSLGLIGLGVLQVIVGVHSWRRFTQKRSVAVAYSDADVARAAAESGDDSTQAIVARLDREKRRQS